MCPLLHALRHRMVSFDVIRLLVSQWPGALQLPIKGSDRYFALHLACSNKASLESIQYLVQEWPEALKRTCAHGLPMHYSCRRDADLLTIQYLIQAWPASLRVANKRGLLPLHEACRFRMEHPEVSAWSTYLKAPSLAAASTGSRSSHYLSIADSPPPPPPLMVLQTLVQAWPATVRKLDKEGLLPLHHLCCCKFDAFIRCAAFGGSMAQSLAGCYYDRGYVALALGVRTSLFDGRDSLFARFVSTGRKGVKQTGSITVAHCLFGKA